MSPKPNPGKQSLNTIQTAIALSSYFESFASNAYPDPLSGGDPWTIGYGTTVMPDGNPVKKGDSCTEEQALRWKRADMRKGKKVLRAEFPYGKR